MTRNLPSQVRPSSPPAEQTRQLATLTSIYRNRLIRGPAGKYTISDRLAPSGDERHTLTCRARELVDALAPGDRNEMAKSIGQMFLAYQQVKLGPDETRATVALYVAQVQEFPNWAVSNGCQTIIRRTSAWPPAAGELRASVAAETRPHEDERAALLSVLNADVFHEPLPGERVRMKEGFEALSAELGVSVRAGAREPTQAEAKEWLEREQENPRPLPKLSEAALRVCGIDTSDPSFAEMREII